MTGAANGDQGGGDDADEAGRSAEGPGGGEAAGRGDEAAVTARYEETARERRIVYRRDDGTVTVAAPQEGYGMLIVRSDGIEVERYYGLAMALDHAAELLGVPVDVLPVPDEGRDMGM